MQVDIKDMIALVEAQQTDAHQRPAPQIERFSRKPIHTLHGFLKTLTCRQLGEVFDRQRDFQLWGDHHHRACSDHLKGGAQDFVAADDFVDGTLHHLDIEPPFEAAGGINHISRVAFGALVHRPQPLLVVRERARAQLPPPGDRLRLRQRLARVERLLLEARLKQGALRRRQRGDSFR